MSPAYSRFVVDLSEAGAHRLGALLEEHETLIYGFHDIGERWRVEVLHEGAPDAAIRSRFEGLIREAGGSAAALRVEPVPDIDWLAENRRDFAPISVGRYFIHGTLEPVAVPPGRVAIELDAGQAFGTGRHATTALCLEAMERLARRRRFGRILDLGTGAGLLAIAAARTWPAPVVATDIDPIAARVARENMRRNRVAGRVAVVTGAGLRPVAGRFDLVLANVLAKPLLGLAREIALCVAAPGAVVLSGILDDQVPAIVARYRAAGLPLAARYRRDGWAALVLARKSGGA